MTRTQAIAIFEQYVIPAIRRAKEPPALACPDERIKAWDNYITTLHAANNISDWQLNHWSLPDICLGP